MDLKKLIKEVLESRKPDCGCGCGDKCGKAPVLNENLQSRILMTENMKYHIDNKKPLIDNTFRYGSKAFLDLWTEARYLYSREAIDLSGMDKEIILETNLGEYGTLEDGTRVPLDFIMEDEEFNLNEAKTKKKDPPIGKPMRSTSGGKAYKVYVRDPKTKRIKTVRFGSGGLKAKINNSKARAAFAKRHKCSTRNDRTKASYWSCRLPRYAKLLGLKSNFSGFW